MDFDRSLLAEGDHRTCTSICAIAAPPTSAPGSMRWLSNIGTGRIVNVGVIGRGGVARTRGCDVRAGVGGGGRLGLPVGENWLEGEDDDRVWYVAKTKVQGFTSLPQ